MSSGAVTLGEIVGRLTMLEVACSHCERRGRLDVAKLIEPHGADTRLPNLRLILAGDCPRAGSDRRFPASRLEPTFERCPGRGGATILSATLGDERWAGEIGAGRDGFSQPGHVGGMALSGSRMSSTANTGP